VSQPDDMRPVPQPEPAPPSGTLVGCALFVIGGLFVIPSGLCTAVGGIGFIVEMVSNPKDLADNFDDLLPFAAVTLTCLAIGIALIWAGLKVRRQ